jgi:glycosyltransferase involved in cell wall biosynthesis
MKIAHLTSVHTRNDTRIFIKQCRSLADHRYETILVVADDQGDDFKENVRIVDVGRLPGRLNRIFKTTLRVLKKAIELDAVIYHFHDPELVPAGLMLKLRGKKVVFDMHEDLPAQILDKTWIPHIFRRVASIICKLAQAIILPIFDNIVLAESCYSEIWLPGCRTTTIKNFPILSEFAYNDPKLSVKENAVCYVGGVIYTRGLKEMVLATNKARVKLILAGPCAEEILRDISKRPEWCTTEFLGKVDRAEVASILSRSIAGLVVLHPTPNYIDTEPTKMFEYMAAGIPVIASDFPTWRKIVECNDCGICVDPLAPKAIAAAIDFIINNPELAQQMGDNGKRAALEDYNWSSEETKLIALYQSLHAG